MNCKKDKKNSFQTIGYISIKKMGASKDAFN